MDWINAQVAKKTVDEYKAGNIKNAALVWRIACLDYWLKNFN
jgi:hypothetical protein